MSDYLAKLNPEQRQAAQHTDGPLLVVAGAGTGKTSTLTHRILHLIHSGVAPEKILAITFTNKAAAEMRERMHHMLTDAKLLDPTISDPWLLQQTLPFMSTFHSLGVYILRRHAPVLGMKKHFTILDQSDSMALLKEAMKSLDIDTKEWDPKRIRGIISRSKGKGYSHNDFQQDVNNPMTERAAFIWPKYEELKRAQHSLDFDDLLLATYRLLKDHKAVREQYQSQWSHIHIDEYQDTNDVQYKLSKLLVGPAQNICAVGDSDQNIYTWRGANVRNILHFERDYPSATTVLLERNYRSTKNILSAAHEVIRKNSARIDKTLYTDSSSGDKISLYVAHNETNEAYWVAHKARQLIDAGASPNDIAILFRTNFQSRVLEEAFLAADVPYQVLGVKFFDRREVKDVLSYIRAALNPDSLADIKRIINVPKRGIGKVSIARIFSGQLDELRAATRTKYEHFQTLLTKIEQFALHNEPSATVRYVIEESGLAETLGNGTADEQERLENIKELVTHATRYDLLPQPDGIEKLLEDAALLGDQDNLKDAKGDKQAVRLMTVHASKGLEFPYLFIVGLEEGLFPSDHGGENRDAEEERRLCYVAITRAKLKLYLSYAQLRRIFGQQSFQAPSQFIGDIPDTLLEAENADAHRHREPIKTIYLDF